MEVNEGHDYAIISKNVQKTKNYLLMSNLQGLTFSCVKNRIVTCQDQDLQKENIFIYLIGE